jgi:hypothetical protein
MTAPTQQPDDNKTTAAKALFIGFFAAALGWAGVLVAAVAVASEQYWAKGQPVRDRNQERRAGWFDTQRAWLNTDHQQRMRRAAAHREWLQSGADPATRPGRPSKGSRIGAALRRTIANVAVAAADFSRGFRDGWQAADARRRQGAGFRETATTRPHQPQQPTPATEPAAAQPADQPHRPETPPADGSKPSTPPDTSTEPETTEGERMPDDTTPTPIAPQRQASDSNATVLATKLDAITTTVTGMSDDTDTLNTVVAALTQKVTAAADLAASAGMPTAAVTAVDTARHATTVVSARLDDFAAGTAAAVDQLTAAVTGLRAVQAAEDRLRASGADGRVFETSAV